MRGYRWADEPAAIEAMQRKVPQSVAACYDLIEHKMLGACPSNRIFLDEERSS
jgi:glutathione S-transferase